MNTTSLVIALVVLVIGVVLGYLLGRLQAQAGGTSGAAELASARAERDAARSQLDQLRADREAMSKEFQRLSAQTAERQAESVDRTARQRLDETRAIMTPLAQSVTAMTERLSQLDRERAASAADLRRQVDTVRLSNESLRRETQALVTALRRPQVRGAWGETQLKRVAEIAGLVERCDFDTQVAFDTDDGGQRPDMRVTMADGKVIFVDAKTPLGNFIDAFATDDEDRREALLDQYVKNVVAHINQLGAKNYWRLDAASPEMVILFLPSDALLQVALDRRADLHEYAASHGIFLASPSILIPMLRAVQHGWRQAAFAQSAQQVAALGREVFERLAVMGSHLDKLGRSLSGAVNAYNSTVGSLEQRVLVTARKFTDLDIASGELAQPSPVEASTRVLTAPELVENASLLEDTIGRLPRAAHSARHESATGDGPVPSSVEHATTPGRAQDASQAG
ncbi:DNA recombination protein RmuC [Propionibacterium cyclohexanicum]|uniref:DNA recombination protein RmuC n=1 Tax=Propionibacterium cyclohexanicum TaxID=64702 RepID=A0A1H9RFZ3_9ACTN|nr:DNA recombination protein RmuC [Propionibacterium cyclohexanicum]SER71584.1 DNA recombination protein RmuC [Propionibacterium cyclohexanicum]